MTNALIGGVVALSLLVQGGLPRKPSPQDAGPYSELLTQEPSEAARVERLQLEMARRGLSLRDGHQVERGPCNMPMIRGDARVDPKSVVPIERGKTDHKIRAVEPSVCWEKNR